MRNFSCHSEVLLPGWCMCIAPTSYIRPSKMIPSLRHTRAASLSLATSCQSIFRLDHIGGGMHDHFFPRFPPISWCRHQTSPQVVEEFDLWCWESHVAGHQNLFRREPVAFSVNDRDSCTHSWLDPIPLVGPMV